MGKIISFHGSDHKCGTSMIALCVAETLADVNVDKKILLLNAVSTSGSVYTPNVCESMDKIRPYLAEHLVDTESVLINARYRDNLYIIDGSSSHFVVDSFPPDMSEYLLEKLKERLDYIIVDTGSDYNLGISLGALFASDEVYMVIRQKENAVRRYEWVKSLYERLGIGINGFIVNMYNKSSAYTRYYLSDRLNCDRDCFHFIKESMHGSEAELEGKSLLQYRDSVFKRNINTLCELISVAGISEDISDTVAEGEEE